MYTFRPLPVCWEREESLKKKPIQTLFWARTFRSDAHEVNDNGKVPFVALSLPILRSVTKSQCQSEILTKRKVTMRKQKLNGKLLFAALFTLHCCKKRKEKKGNKNEMTNKLLCCAQPPSLQKKEKQTKQKTNKKTKKETKIILANLLLWLCLASISAKKKTNKKEIKKTSKATKSRMANYLPWPCPASISAWQQLAPVSDQGSMPIMPMGKLKKNYTKVLQTRSRRRIWQDISFRPCSRVKSDQIFWSRGKDERFAENTDYFRLLI